MSRRRRQRRLTRRRLALWLGGAAVLLAVAGLGLLHWSRTPAARALLLEHGVQRYREPVQAAVDSVLAATLAPAAHGSSWGEQEADWPLVAPPGAFIRCRAVRVDTSLTLWEWEERVAAALRPAGAGILWGERLHAPRGYRGLELLRLDVGVPGHPTHTLVLGRGEGGLPRIHWGTGEAESVEDLLGSLDQPTVALVIDDWGNSDNDVTRSLLRLDVPLTLSILPGLSYSRHFALQATDLAVPRRGGEPVAGGLVERRRRAGCPVTLTLGRRGRVLPRRRREVMLHLPMEPVGYPGVNPGRDPVMVGMSRDEIAAILDRDLRGLPGVSGVNNHMGSAATADRETMERLVSILRERGLFFLDSMTTSRSVAAEVAAAAGLPLLRNRLFLDQKDPHEESIRRRLDHLVEVARRTGSVIGIGHPYPQTLAVLQRELPRYRREGIRFVTVSELIALREAAATSRVDRKTPG